MTDAPTPPRPSVQATKVLPGQTTSHILLQKTSPDATTTETLVKVHKLRTSHRAAAAAATAVIAAQAQEEAAPLGVVLAQAMNSKSNQFFQPDTSLQEHNTMEMLLYAALGKLESKKRESEAIIPTSKRAKAVPSDRVVQKTPQSSTRGKKRRPAPVSEAALLEASPIIPNGPSLPLTTDEIDSHDTKNVLVNNATAWRQPVADVSRQCEFCKSAANICVLMHCLACRRVYHAGCFVQAFKPLVNHKEPLLDQMARLQLQAPARRGTLFRCASCKAAFLDFYESGGYMWECDCPTCLQPDTIQLFRRRKLVQMMNATELKRQQKKEHKERKKSIVASTNDNVPIVTSTQAKPAARHRPTQDIGATSDALVATLRKGKPLGECATDASMRQQMTINVQCKSEVMNQRELEPVQEPEVSEVELVSAVRVLFDVKTISCCFPVMCSRMSSLHVAGIMKTGKCKWFLTQPAWIQCNCCDKGFQFSEFVHHTDSSLVPDAKGDKLAFLFVEHRDNTQYTPLKQFLPALKYYAERNHAKKMKNGSTQEAIAALSEAKAESAVSRLQPLALYTRLTRNSFFTVADSEYVAHVVCLSPKYVLSMANGSLVDLVVRSRTSAPGDSFPRKVGWLSFSRQAVTALTITCRCCDANFSFKEFAGHAGILLTESKKKPRHLLYVVEQQDNSALMPLTTFMQSLDTAYTNNVLETLLEKLPPLPL